jgi:redox-sensing transcriptional repressor
VQWGTTTIHSSERLEAVIEQLDVDLVILAVPASAAQEIADRAVEAGVRGILNFAPVQIKVPDSIPVEDVNLVMQLEALSFKITRGGAGE